MKTLKKLVSVILCASTLTLCACGSNGRGTAESTTNTTNTQPIVDNSPLCDGNTLKILAITSSFGLNTTQFLYDIAKAEGCTNVIVGRLYGSGCTLERHVDNALNSNNYYEYTKNSTGKWEQINNIPMSYGLKDEDWDIIFIQQSADQSPDPNTYALAQTDYIDTLVDYVNKNKTNPNARFVWNLTWAFQNDCVRNTFEKYNNDQMTMYNALISTLKEKVIVKDFYSAIIPTGTAIQNVRTSFIGDTLTKDTLHLNNLGRAIAGYTAYATLTGKPLTEINLGEVSSYDLRDPLMLTDAQKQVIIECVNNALKNPYEVTTSAFTEQ